MRVRQLLLKNYDETRVLQRIIAFSGSDAKTSWYVQMSFAWLSFTCHGTTFKRKWWFHLRPQAKRWIAFEYYGQVRKDAD